MANPTRTVLVTGGTGVIGAWVTRGLLDRSITPVVYTRGTTSDIGGAINGDVQDRIVHAQGDVLDAGALERALRDHGVDVVVHMASAKPWQMEAPFVPRSQPRVALEQIALGTLGVLDAAVAAGVRRVVYASSKAVFAPIRDSHGAPAYRPLPPDYPREASMLYGIGKVTAEDLGRYYAAHYGIEFVAIRFASSFGPLKRGPAPLESAILAAAAGDPVRLRPFVDGQKDDHVYNKDVAEAFVLAAVADGPLGWAYNVGSGRGTDHSDIAAALRHHFPDADVAFIDEDEVRREGPSITDRARCVMDIDAARADFGYEPRYTPLETAIEDFLREGARVTRSPAH